MIRVNSDVKSEKLNERLFVSETKKIGEVVRVILGRIDGWDFPGTEDVSVDSPGNVGKLGDAIGDMLVGIYSQQHRGGLTGPLNLQMSVPSIPSSASLPGSPLRKQSRG